jgi:hypothetical protein
MVDLSGHILRGRSHIDQTCCYHSLSRQAGWSESERAQNRNSPTRYYPPKLPELRLLRGSMKTPLSLVGRAGPYYYYPKKKPSCIEGLEACFRLRLVLEQQRWSHNRMKLIQLQIHVSSPLDMATLSCHHLGTHQLVQKKSGQCLTIPLSWIPSYTSGFEL